MAVPNVRYKYDFESSLDIASGTPNKYTILIRDTTLGSDLDLEFCTDARGFEINHPTEDHEFQDVIKGSSCVIGFIVQNSTDQTFVENLIGDQEGKYFIEIIKNSSSFWKGVIVQDESRVENRDFPYIFEITAIDGITELEALEGDIIPPNPQFPSNGTVYTALQRIIYMLNQTRTALLYEDVDGFLITGARWFEKDMPSDVDPLANMAYTDLNIDFTIDDSGVRQFKSFYEILNNILRLLNLRLYQSFGVFHIMQTNELRFNQINLFAYQKTYALTNQDPQQAPEGVIDSNFLTDLKKNILCGGAKPILDTQYVAEAGNIYAYLGAVKSSTIGYDVELEEGYRGVALDLSSPFNTNAQIQSVAGSTLLFTGFINSRIKNNSTDNVVVNYTADFYIKIGSYYYDGATDTWTTTKKIANIYNHNVNIPAIDVVKDQVSNISITTPPPPANGTLEFEIITTLTGPGSPTILFTELTITAEYRNANGGPVKVGFTATNTNVEAVNSSIVIDMGESIIGDRPAGDFLRTWKTWNGTGYKNSEAWWISQVGNQYPVNELLVREIVKVRQIPIRKWEMNVIGDYETFYTLVDGDVREYIFNGGTFTGKTEQWDGTWLELNVPFAGGGGSGPFDFPRNESSGFNKAAISDNQVTGGYGRSSYESEALATVNQEVSGTLSTLQITPVIDNTIKAGDVLTIRNDFGQQESLTVTVDHTPGEVLTFTEVTFANVYPNGSTLQINSAQLKGKVENLTLQDVVDEGNVTNDPLIFTRDDGTTAGRIDADDPDQFGFGIVGQDADDNLTNLAVGGNNIYFGTGAQFIANNNALPHGYLKLGGTPVTDSNGNDFYPVGFQQIEQEIYKETFTDNTNYDISNGLDTRILGPTSLVNNYTDPSDYEFRFRLQEESTTRSTEIEYWFEVNGVESPRQTTTVSANTIVTVTGSSQIQTILEIGDNVELWVRAVDTGQGRTTRIRGDETDTELVIRQLGFGNFGVDINILGTGTTLQSIFSESIVYLTGTGPYTLPALSTLTNKTLSYNLKNISGSTVTVNTTGADTIDGVSTFNLDNYENARIVYDDNEFYKI